LTFSRTRDPSAPSRAVRVLGPPEAFKVSESMMSWSSLDSCSWDLIVSVMVEGRLEDNSRKLAGSKSTLGLSDLDSLSLGRDVVLDGALDLSPGRERLSVDRA
jgi:hypothetical protein